MKPLLFLCHRIPYPPNKGDKIRAFHLLKSFSNKYDVFLGTYVDDKNDHAYINDLKQYCKEVFCINISPKQARIKSLLGLFNSKALSVRYYESAEMKSWVNKTINDNNIKDAFVYCSSMAQFVESPEYTNIFKVLDMVDVDSSKWREYAGKSYFPLSKLYKRESELLLNAEKKYTTLFNETLLVSDQEVQEFLRHVDGDVNKPLALYNGVDIEYFDPDLHMEQVYDKDLYHIIFTGVMDYRPNVEAVSWFANDILPKLLEENPKVHFNIVGSSPSNEVLKLNRSKAISVHGRVEDMRPYLNDAHLVVAPLKTARGIQNKVLEAMAMRKPVIMTSVAAAGINHFPYQEYLVADSVTEFISKIDCYIKSDLGDIHGKDLRAFVADHYSWFSAHQVLEKIYQ